MKYSADHWKRYDILSIFEVPTLQIHPIGPCKKTSFFASLWSKVRAVQEGISYLQSPAMILILQLQTDMNKIFQMRYYRALQIKGLQSCKPSKFAKNGDGPRASIEHNDFSWNWPSDLNDFWLQTLTAYNFTINCHLKSYTQCGKTQETMKKIELTKELWNMNDCNVNEWFLK